MLYKNVRLKTSGSYPFFPNPAGPDANLTLTPTKSEEQSTSSIENFH
jgi:hypothetical protein